MEYLSIKQLSELYPFSEASIRAYMARGEFKSAVKRVGKKILIDKLLFNRWVEGVEAVYSVQPFCSGNYEEAMECKSDLGFPLRSGGATSVSCYMVGDEEQAIAFVTNEKDATLIAKLLNGDKNES